MFVPNVLPQPLQNLTVKTVIDGLTRRVLDNSLDVKKIINPLAPELFLNFSTPCIKNVNNTGTKRGRIMK
jgi:hypothetical protein